MQLFLIILFYNLKKVIMDAIKKLLEKGLPDEARKLLEMSYEPTVEDEKALVYFANEDLLNEYLAYYCLSADGLKALIGVAKAGKPSLLFWYLENFYRTDKELEAEIYALGEEQLIMALIKKGASPSLELKVIESGNEKLIFFLLEHTELHRGAEALLIKQAPEDVLKAYLDDNVLYFEGCEALCTRDNGAYIPFYLESVANRHDEDRFARHANDRLLRAFIAKHELPARTQLVVAGKGEDMLKAYIEKHELADEVLCMLFAFPLTDKEFLRAYFAKYELSPLMQGFLKTMAPEAYVKLYEEKHEFIENAEEAWTEGLKAFRRNTYSFL